MEHGTRLKFLGWMIELKSRCNNPRRDLVSKGKPTARPSLIKKRGTFVFQSKNIKKMYGRNFTGDFGELLGMDNYKLRGLLRQI